MSFFYLYKIFINKGFIMRRFDKLKNIRQANLLAEERYLKSKGLLKESDNIEEIEGLSKRSAYNAAMHRHDETPDWDITNKNKYSDQIYSSMSHINPEVQKNIKNFANRFNLNVDFKKRVGGSDDMPVFELYFNDGEGVSEYNYSFKFNVTPMDYEYSTFKSREVERPQGFDRAFNNLVKYIQTKELSYHSNLK